MTTPKFPAHTPANSEDDDTPPTRPGSTFINALKDIGCGAAAGGQPWPEPELRIGRRIALADVDCARAGLTIALEMLLAGERIRQNGPDEDYPGDRVMEGLIMACLAINGQAASRVRPQE